jgi:hypothetical protein
MEHNSLHWKTIEYFHTEKGSDWFWALGIVSVSIAVIALILGNILFAVLILLAAFVLGMYATRKPHVVDVQIDRRGVTVGEYRYPYTSLESFGIVHYPDHSKLLIKSKKTFMPYITVIMLDIDPDEVAHYLEEYLPEDEHYESFSERFMEFLGF